jgi:hypothetical protein
MAVGAVVARILTQYSDKGSKQAQKDIAKLQKKIDAFGKKALKNFALAGTAAAAFAVKIGIDAVQGAAADEKAQTSLAMAIRNSTAATEEAIAANTKFLDQLELQVAVDNDELIPALQKLTIATGNLQQAQNLLVLSTDLAVFAQKDMNTVATAVSRALGGNFTALTKLGLPIDAVALKQKDLNKILSDWAVLTKGAASAAANTYAGRLKILQLSFNQVLDKLGYALMPLVLEFTEYLTAPGGLIDALDEWIETNETQLQESLEGITVFMKLLIDNGDNLTSVLNLLVQVTGFLNTGIIGTIRVFETLLGLAILGKFVKWAKGMGLINKEFMIGGKRVDVITDKAAKAATATEKVGKGFSTAGATKSTNIITRSLDKMGKKGKIAAGILAGIGMIYGAVKTITGPSDSELLAQMQAQAKKDFQEEQAAKEQARLDKILYDNEIKLQIQRDKAAEAARRRQAIRDAQELKAQKLLADQRKKIANLGIKGQVDEEDPKQLNAAIALLERQKDINAIDKARLERMKEEVLLLKVRNDLATRYDDILKALADNKITTQEVQILALKWGVATEAVDAYLLQLKIIEDGTISDDEVISLAKSWGSTQAQAAQYLDFFQALNDGILSDAEIEKLKAKWKLTEDQVKMYADFVGVVNDGKLTDAEIIKIKDKWKLTTDQVVDYIKQIGSPVSYSGSLIDPARAAEIGWLSATAALERYLALLKAGTGVVTPPTTVTPPTVVPPTTTVTPQGPCGASRPYYNYYTGECVASAADIKPRGTTSSSGTVTDGSTLSAAAIASAVAKATGDVAGAAIAAAGVNPTTIASAESGAIGAASIAAQLAAADEAVKIASSLAAFKAKEAADAAIARAEAADRDYDERFRFMGSSTMNNASSIVGSGTATSSPTINITVQGSVTSEQDLVQTVRNGLLNTQYNGNSLILQAI